MPEFPPEYVILVCVDDVSGGREGIGLSVGVEVTPITGAEADNDEPPRNDCVIAATDNTTNRPIPIIRAYFNV